MENICHWLPRPSQWCSGQLHAMHSLCAFTYSNKQMRCRSGPWYCYVAYIYSAVMRFIGWCKPVTEIVRTKMTRKEPYKTSAPWRSSMRVLAVSFWFLHKTPQDRPVQQLLRMYFISYCYTESGFMLARTQKPAIANHITLLLFCARQGFLNKPVKT